MNFFRVILGLATATIAVAEVSGPAELNARALAAHRQRALNEASKLYAQLLKSDPPVAATPAQKVLVRKFAPRLHGVADEYFPLKDVVAIIHPDRPLIGYHLFWEDDIAFPSDNEPCDHEIVWVEYDPATLKVRRVSTYFHGRILAPAAAPAEADTHDGRPWIGVEWGFHGSIPWEGGDLAAPILREHWQQAHAGRSGPPDPLARGWPEKYPGNYEDYVAFAVPVDPRELLAQRDLIWVSRWPMAALNRYSLRYNVAVKTEWPPGSPGPAAPPR